MTPIKGKTHDSSDQENKLREDILESDTSSLRVVTANSTAMANLRAIVGRLGGPQKARQLFSNGSHQRPAADPKADAESLATLVELLAEQHSAQELGKVEDGE